MVVNTEDRLRQLIRDELEVQGVKQVHVARTLGLTEKHMSQVLNGKAGLSPALADAILSVLGRRFVVTTRAVGSRRTP